MLYSKANDDVKMSISVDSLSKLLVSQKLDVLLESEEEVTSTTLVQLFKLPLQVPDLIDGLIERLGYHERRKVVKMLCANEDNFIQRSEPHVGRVIPENGLDSGGEQGKSSEEEGWEGESYAQEGWEGEGFPLEGWEGQGYPKEYY